MGNNTIINAIRNYIQSLNFTVRQPRSTAVTQVLPHNPHQASNTANTTRNLERDIENFARALDEACMRIGRGLGRLFLLGILLHIAGYFYPELQEKIPVIWDIGDGAIEFVEFVISNIFKLFGSILNGNFSTAWAEYSSEFREIVSEFANWLTTL